MNPIKLEIKETQEQIKQLEKRICELKSQAQQNGWISYNTHYTCFQCYFKMVDGHVAIAVIDEKRTHVVELEGREMLLPNIHVCKKTEDELVPIKGYAAYEIAAEAVNESIHIDKTFTPEMLEVCAKCQYF